MSNVYPNTTTINTLQNFSKKGFEEKYTEWYVAPCMLNAKYADVVEMANFDTLEGMLIAERLVYTCLTFDHGFTTYAYLLVKPSPIAKELLEDVLESLRSCPALSEELVNQYMDEIAEEHCETENK